MRFTISRRAPWVRVVSLVCVALALGSLPRGEARACDGTRGGIPVCSPTIAFWKSGLRRTVVPTSLVNVSFCLMPGTTPACAPLARVEVSMEVRDITTGQLVGTGSTVIAPPFVSFGATSCGAVLVPVSNPQTGGPLPPGLYSIRGAATLVLVDGTRATRGGDTCFAVIEPSTPNPAVPRLEIENITPDGLGGEVVHPGDEQVNSYLFRNNDPVHPVTVDVLASNVQNSRQPTLDVPGPGGTALSSFAEPIQGDNFPLAFADDPMGLACLPLPPVPGDPAIPSISRQIVLQPGEERTIDIVSRGWKLCQTGSGCEQIVEGIAAWDDGTSAEWCVGGISVASSEVIPAYSCPDSGAVAQVFPQGPNAMRVFGQPVQGLGVQADLFVDPPEFVLNGAPRTVQLQAEQIDAELSRFVFRAQLDDSDGPQQFELRFPLVIEPLFPPVVPEPPQVFPMPNAPFGFQDVYPTTKLMLPYAPQDPSFPPFAAELMLQAQADSGLPQFAGDALIQPLALSVDPLGPGVLLVTIRADNFLPSLSSFDLRVALNVRGFMGRTPVGPCNPADLAPPFGQLTFGDISAFLAAFQAMDPAADLAPPFGQLTFGDISAFLAAFSGGCP
jgi:hypothetical protein